MQTWFDVTRQLDPQRRSSELRSWMSKVWKISQKLRGSVGHMHGGRALLLRRSGASVSSAKPPQRSGAEPRRQPALEPAALSGLINGWLRGGRAVRVAASPPRASGRTFRGAVVLARRVPLRLRDSAELWRGSDGSASRAVRSGARSGVAGVPAGAVRAPPAHLCCSCAPQQRADEKQRRRS